MRTYALNSMSDVNSMHALCVNRYASFLIIHGRRQAMIAVTYLLFLVSSPFHQGYQIYLFAVEVTGIQYSYFVIVQPVRIVRLTLILKLITRRLQERLRCPALAQVKVVRGARYYYISLDTSQSVYNTIICARTWVIPEGEGIENPNTALNGPSSARQRNAIQMAFCWRAIINGPLSARQRNAIQMAFCWRADDGPTLNAGLVAL